MPKYPVWGVLNEDEADHDIFQRRAPKLGITPLAPGFTYFYRKYPLTRHNWKMAASFVKPPGQSTNSPWISISLDRVYRQYRQSLAPDLYDGESQEKLTKYLTHCEESWPMLLTEEPTPNVRKLYGVLDESDQLAWAASFLRGRPYKCYREHYGKEDTLVDTAEECSWVFFKTMLLKDMDAHQSAMRRYRLREKWLGLRQETESGSPDSTQNDELQALERRIGWKETAVIESNGVDDDLQKWLSIKQEEGQQVRKYSKQLRLLELKIGRENLGYEMTRDRFVMGLRENLREKVVKHVRQVNDMKTERDRIEAAAIVEEGFLPRDMKAERDRIEAATIVEEGFLQTDETKLTLCPDREDEVEE
jgi:hypothetical protein